jgi:hypothetical protein
MTPLKHKVKYMLEECRILILGGQVLIGFSSEAVLEPGFKELPQLFRGLCAAGTVCLVLAVGLLMWPAAYHRIACAGHNRQRLLTFATAVVAVALLPFALGMGTSVTVVGERVGGSTLAFMMGTSAVAIALLLWYLVPVAARRNQGPGAPAEPQGPTPVTDKVQQVLTEMRIVIPGAQALLGFGTIVVLMDAFKELPWSLKVVHIVGVGFIALAIALLMAPSAYHRIAEHGEATERFHRLSTRLLLLAMAALAPGMAAALWVVLEVATGSRAIGVTAATTTVVLFYAAWFVVPLAVRRAVDPDIE